MAEKIINVDGVNTPKTNLGKQKMEIIVSAAVDLFTKEGFYQTTTWQVDCVAEPSTRLEMLLSGQLDNYVLGANIAGFLKVAEAMLAQGVV